MSHSSNPFHAVLHMLRETLVAALKLTATVVGLCIKGIGRVLVAIAEFILKIAEK